MTKLYTFFAIAAVLLTLPISAAPRTVTPEIINESWHSARPGHPRLYLRDYQALEAGRQTEAGKALTGRILHDAGKMLDYPPVERVMTGNQMLSVSRNVLYRVHTLAVAYRLSGDRRYADKAVAEMRNAAAFQDWNPQHFLDVAEMTLALSFGYDWLYELLSDEERRSIEEAIIEKGLKPSYGTPGYLWWIGGTNNWNQVCHAGMTAGAIAVFEKAPELAAKTIARAVNNLPLAMHASYYPRGAYPEGPVYWSYGSEFNAALLAMLESAFGTDFELSSVPGFSETGDYMLAVRAPGGEVFSYADSIPRLGVDFAQVWLARRFERPDWIPAETQKELLAAGARRHGDVSQGGPRMLPLAMIFFTDYKAASKEAPLHYFSGADAAVPVAMFRTGWTPGAGYLGVKAGSPSWAHGHMDAGSFVYEADGVRWAVDLGQDNYDKFLARKMTLWNSAQDSDRWKIFRFGPLSHNILMIGGQLQLAKSKAYILECTENSARVELSDLYEGRADRVTRDFRLLPDRSAEITDRIAGAKPGDVLRWQMLIRDCDAEIRGNDILLSQAGKTLTVSVDTPVSGKWSVIDTRQLQAEWDSPNPGCRIIAWEQKVPADGKLVYLVRLSPERELAKDAVLLGSGGKQKEERIPDAFQLQGEFTLSCKVRPEKNQAPDPAWKSCGIGIHRDSQNYFHLSFCETPVDRGSRRFIELKQRKEGKWESLAGIGEVDFRSNFNWKYGEEYQLSLTRSRNALTGRVCSSTGEEFARITIPLLSDEAVTSGNALLHCSGIRTLFSGLKLEQ